MVLPEHRVVGHWPLRYSRLAEEGGGSLAALAAADFKALFEASLPAADLTVLFGVLVILKDAAGAAAAFGVLGVLGDEAAIVEVVVVVVVFLDPAFFFAGLPDHGSAALLSCAELKTKPASRSAPFGMTMMIGPSGEK